MSLSRLQTAFEERLRIVSKQITWALLTDSDTQQDFAFAAALPDNAIVVAQWIDVDQAFASPVGLATAATKTGAAEPYVLTAGWTIVLDTNNAGNETVTFDAAAGYVEGDDYYPLTDQDTLTVIMEVDGGAAQTCLFAGATTSATAIRDQINAQITGVAATVETGLAYRKAAIKALGAGPTYRLAPAQTIVLDTDNAGNETVTFDAAAATVTDTTAYPCADQTGLTEKVTIDGGVEQTVTFGTCTTAAHAVGFLNAQLIDCFAAEVGGHVVITSDLKGTGSAVAIGTGTCALTWAAPAPGTGDVIDITRVTKAEVKTRIEADSIATVDITGATPVISSPTTGATSELDFKSGAALAPLGLSVQVIVGTASQVKIKSDMKGTDSRVIITGGTSSLSFLSSVSGTGDVADIANVTAAEVIDRVKADTISDCIVASGGKFTIVSPTTGAASELDFKGGTALAALGLAVEVKVGVAATAAGTATFDIGTSDDYDSMIDGASVSSTGIKQGIKGIGTNGWYSAKTPNVRVDGTQNMILFDEGDATVYVAYIDATKAL